METTVTGKGSLFGAMKKVMAPQESALSNIEKNTAETRNTLAKSIVKIEKNTNPVTANKGLKGFFKNMFGKSAEAEMEGKKKAKKDGEEESKFRKFMKEKWGAVAENKKAIAFGGLLKKIFIGLLAGFAIFALPKDFWVGIGNSLLKFGQWVLEIDWKGVFESIKDAIISVKNVINKIIDGIFGKEVEGKEKRQGGFLGQGGDFSGFLSFFGIDGDEVSGTVSKFVAVLGAAITGLAIAFPGKALELVGKTVWGLTKLGGKGAGKAIDLLGGGKEGMAQRSMTPEQIKMSQDRAKAYAENAKKTGPRVGKPTKAGGGWFKALMGKLGKFGQTIMKLGGSVVRGLVTMGPWGWGILLAAGAGLLIYSYWDEISKGFENVGKFLTDGVKSLVNKFKSFDVSAVMEKMIRGVPLLGDNIADFMFGSGASKKADIKKEREEGMGKEFVQKTQEERNEYQKENNKKNAGKGGAGEIIKPQRSKEERLEENERLIANTKARMATIAKRRGGATAESIGRMNSLNEQLRGLQDVNKSIKAEGSKATPVKSGGGSAIRKINPKNIGIDWDFISKKEGGSKLNGYVPDPDGSKSGVTIATGFDLGARNIKDLEGLPQDLQSKLAPYLGLQGQNAAAMLRQRPLEITAKEAKQIDKMSKGAAVNKLQREWNKRAEETGGKKFEDLSSAQQTIAASVAFQYGSLSKTPNFRKAMQSGDWSKAINELENFGDSYGSRRKSEAQYLMASLDPNQKIQAMNSLQNENAAGKMGNNVAPTIISPTVNNNSGGGETYLPLPATAKHDKFDNAFG